MKNNDAEQILLNNASLEDLINMKIEEEFAQDLKKANEKPKITLAKEIKDVPREFVFSKNSIYRIFNRNSKTETFINGVQADSLLGIQNNIREKMLKGELSAFVTDEAYVKFEKAEF